MMDEHHAYLKKFTEQGDVLLSGLKAEGGGGVILVRFNVFDSQDYAKEW